MAVASRSVAGLPCVAELEKEAEAQKAYIRMPIKAIQKRPRNSVGVECAHEAGDAGHQAVSSSEQPMEASAHFAV